MNTKAFLADPTRYFLDSHAQFEAFGGPCVYFHRECLRAGRDDFLSQRHLEMLYATLTAWGMHRMGDGKATKTKLNDWERFRDSLLVHKNALQQLLGNSMLQLSDSEYSDAVLGLRACYAKLDLSLSSATLVVNSKALHHVLPELIPPIDRQYTMRFFKQPSDKWRGGKKDKYRQIPLPPGRDAQFDLFHKTCVKIKQLADQIDPSLFEDQWRRFGVTAPKAMDNAVVNFVRTVSRGQEPLEP